MTPQRVEDDLAILSITQRRTDVAQPAAGQPANLSLVDSAPSSSNPLASRP